jgi:hypothetical protein
MTPNASILSLLTISGKDEEIFFIYLKELEEIAPSEFFWYDEKGKNANASYIWQEKKIKQWLVIGEDSKINYIFESLIQKRNHIISFENTEVNFQIISDNIIKEESHKDDIYTIEGVPLCGEHEIPIKYSHSGLKTNISFLIEEKNNCSYIDGYLSNLTIKPVQPFGLFPENFLFNCINENTLAVKDVRGLFYDLSGSKISKTSNGDPESLFGFVQASNNFRNEHKVLIKNIDGTEIIGESDLDSISGKWHINLKYPCGKAQFLIQNKTTSSFIYGTKFYLIKNINIETNIIGSVIVDFYKREFPLSEKMEIYKPLIKPINWDFEAAPDTIQAQIELSDKLTNILLSLGKEIVINDPFLFGDFEENNNILKLTSISQQIFINALFIAIAKGEISSIQIIGNWHKAKNFIKVSQEDMILKYKSLYKLIKTNFKNSQIFKLKIFDLILSKTPFHDRYWLGGADQSVLYHISNSINGAFESGELTISPIIGNEFIKIKNKVLDRLNNNEKISLIN